MCPGPDGRTYMKVVCPVDVSEIHGVDIYLSLGKYQILFLSLLTYRCVRGLVVEPSCMLFVL